MTDSDEGLDLSDQRGAGTTCRKIEEGSHREIAGASDGELEVGDTLDGEFRDAADGDVDRVARRADRWNRRDALRAALALPVVTVAGSLGASMGPSASMAAVGSQGSRAWGSRRQRPRIAVVGAGAFGGWTALHLVRGGADVTLLDAWGPGNSRASSGGETRVIRGTYGPDRIYVEMVARSLELWQEEEERQGRELYRRTGVLWLVGEDDEYERASLPLLEDAGLSYERLTPAQVSERFPVIDPDGVSWAIYEPGAGYLKAWRSCVHVLQAFLAEGGRYRQARARPGTITGEGMDGVELDAGDTLSADAYVFACGSWLRELFPDLLGDLIRPTRQEVFYFGTPAGDGRYREDRFPVWVDNGERLYYGIPGSHHRGFKVADDTRGPLFDLGAEERVPTPERVRAARRYLSDRFPGLADAPLIESRVCHYENTPDQDFIVDRHPEADNLWVVGGGSGHGFKHGPALGELVAAAILGEAEPEPRFSLTRFGNG